MANRIDLMIEELTSASDGGRAEERSHYEIVNGNAAETIMLNVALIEPLAVAIGSNGSCLDYYDVFLLSNRINLDSTRMAVFRDCPWFDAVERTFLEWQLQAKNHCQTRSVLNVVVPIGYNLKVWHSGDRKRCRLVKKEKESFDESELS